MTVVTLLFIVAAFQNTWAEGDEKNEKSLPFKPNVLPVIEIAKTSKTITIDAILNDEEWQDAVRLGNFTETYPGDMVRPPVQTEVWVTYDSKNLYVAFIAEGDPEQLRVALRDRDEVWRDDYVGILLDTYGDASWYYEFFINPYGIQMDLLATSNNEDMSADYIFSSDGRVTEQGYLVEVAIPFSSLRFPDRTEHTWRVNFWRDHKRDARARYSWAGLDRDKNCFPCQFGTITGISNIQRSKSLDILPSFVSSQHSQIKDADDAQSGMNNGPILGDIGVNAKYSVSPNLVAEITVNPDFSQIESDAAQIDVNNTFALFFPERRPFFQEGSDLYNTFLNVVYTRTLNNPILAGKLTGRFNRTSFVWIGGRDENSPMILPFEEKSIQLANGQSTSNIFRFRQGFAEDSHVGALVTHRMMDNSGTNTVMGVDASHRFLEHYEISGQYLYSSTTEPNEDYLNSVIENDYGFDLNERFGDEGYTLGLDGETYQGHGFVANMGRYTRHYDTEIQYRELSPTFRADNGFINSNSRKQYYWWQGYAFYLDENPFFNQIRPSLLIGQRLNYNNLVRDEWAEFGVDFDMTHQTNAGIEMLSSNENFASNQFNGLHRISGFIQTRMSEYWELGIWGNYGRFIYRDRDNPQMGLGYNLELWGMWRPTDQFNIEPTLVYSKLDAAFTDEDFFAGYIFRTRMKYQFTRELSTRLIVQYNDFGDNWSFEPLASYKMNPFTVLYVGSSVNYYSLDGARGYTQGNRTYFLKFQYLMSI